MSKSSKTQNNYPLKNFNEYFNKTDSSIIQDLFNIIIILVTHFY
ncbi:unnamed protein product [Paramecium sonneborni]|uniref:Uncharacterized protein n=1 Tax=Paramecium sonneborni TaxID=65129 RepID=A0A8S1MXP3_9CILI|nr:unnamed protein product [Paramecium sonneborni]